MRFVNKRKIIFLFGTFAVLSISFLCAFQLKDKDQFSLAKREIALRKIGHEILLQAGDRNSRVLPIEKFDNEHYRIRFEREIAFDNDSLMQTVYRVLGKYEKSTAYLVNVMSDPGDKVVYGFGDLGTNNELRSCDGRSQPKGRYAIDINFKSDGLSTKQQAYLLASLPWLAFALLLVKKSPSKINLAPSNAIILGDSKFIPTLNCLIVAGAKQHLTKKEVKLLQILVAALNQTVERSRLQKEIWEDEGVIVGRSLDVFISRIRKKFEADARIKIINIHNKGYKLSVD